MKNTQPKIRPVMQEFLSSTSDYDITCEEERTRIVSKDISG